VIEDRAQVAPVPVEVVLPQSGRCAARVEQPFRRLQRDAADRELGLGRG
jgi:hypothetical protein